MAHLHAGPVLPTEQEAKLAATARQVLARRDGEALQLQVKPTGQETVALDLPPVVTRLILDALKETAAGHAVALVPVEAEFTTQQAADLLNVSRPYLIGLIDAGVLPVRMVGNQRRIPLRNLLDYKPTYMPSAERRFVNSSPTIKNLVLNDAFAFRRCVPRRQCSLSRLDCEHQAPRIAA